MYAIIENGGKQYKAVEGGFIEIDLLPDEVGKKKTFDKVLLLSTDGRTDVGEPYLKGVSVDATIISHFKAPKIIVFKYRAKQRYRVKTGHRQKYSRVLVDSIAFTGKSAAKKTTTKPKTELKKAAPGKTVKSTTTPAKKAAPTKAKSTTKKTSAAKAATKNATSKKPAASSTKKPKTSKARTTTKKTPAAKTTAAKKTTSADKK